MGSAIPLRASSWPLRNFTAYIPTSTSNITPTTVPSTAPATTVPLEEEDEEDAEDGAVASY
eukprot:m.167789 g.167789  ORF g.167789 m.167789 type:complete len:61 (+) comp21136_c0_seq6:82-264(+)